MGKFKRGQSVTLIRTGEHTKIREYRGPKYLIEHDHCSLVEVYEEELDVWPPNSNIEEKIATYLKENLKVKVYVGSYEWDGTTYVKSVSVRLELNDEIISESEHNP